MGALFCLQRCLLHALIIQKCLLRQTLSCPAIVLLSCAVFIEIAASRKMEIRRNRGRIGKGGDVKFQTLTDLSATIVIFCAGGSGWACLMNVVVSGNG